MNEGAKQNNAKHGNTIKYEGEFGIYGVRQSGKKFEARWTSKISGISKPYTGSGETIEEAVAKLEFDVKRDLGINTFDKETLTAAQWCDFWLSQRIGRRSYCNWESHIRRYIKPVLGEIKVKDLRYTHFQRILDLMASGDLSEGSRKKGLTNSEIKATKEPLAKKTLMSVRSTFQMIFEEAEYDHYLERVPWKKLYYPDQAKPKKEIIILSKSKEMELLDYLIYQDEEGVGIMILLQDIRGLRASEVCGLKWENIDLDNIEEGDGIKVRQSLQKLKEFDKQGKPTGHYVFQETKLKSQSSKRDLGLNKILLMKLKKHKTRYLEKCLQEGKTPSEKDYVFISPAGQPYHSRSLYKALQRILKKLELEKIGTHALRHMFATKLREDGIDRKMAQLLMGHSDPLVCERYYQHVRDKDENKALAKMDSTLGLALASSLA